MTKKLSLLLAVILLLTSLGSNAFALNYSGCQNNEATFETLEEARLSGPAAVQNLEENTKKTFISHPVLDGYPEGTTFIYRSANLFGGRAAARLNTTIVVYAEQHFDEKDAAFAYLQELGLIDIIDEAVGSVTLVTPADGVAFGLADQKNYYKLQTAMLAQKESGKDAEGNAVSYCDAEYFGGYCYLYVIGIDGGATFLNNYVASAFDFVSRIAGMLLINGAMDKLYDVAALVPVYLVHPTDLVLNAYQQANETTSYAKSKETMTYYNQQLPLQKVVVALTEKDNAAYIKDAYYNMFIKAMRLPVRMRGIYSTGTPYQGYGFDQAPYTLCNRNALINGVTEDGIYLFRHCEERFSDIVEVANGEYLQTWFEYLPAEIVDGTAAEHSIPLVLANQGGSDDPRQFVDEIGLLDLAGEKRFAIVASENQYINGAMSAEYGYTNGILHDALPALANYMLETYPALDPSRVYVTGYSQGGRATIASVSKYPEVFAAAVPMAAAPYVASAELDGAFDDVNLPFMVMTSCFDSTACFNAAENCLAARYQALINLYLSNNEMEQVEFDFETYPICGFDADLEVRKLLNNEYWNTTWYINNDDGIPMIAATVTEDLVHGLYPEYGKLFWDFVCHYSRNQETGEIEYNPYAN